MAIEWKGDPAFLDMCAELKRLRDEYLDYLTAQSFHGALHVPPYGEPAEGCYFCSMRYAFFRFWTEIRKWSGTCDEGCGRPMYECGYACEFWYDY